MPQKRPTEGSFPERNRGSLFYSAAEEAKAIFADPESSENILGLFSLLHKIDKRVNSKIQVIARSGQIYA